MRRQEREVDVGVGGSTLLTKESVGWVTGC